MSTTARLIADAPPEDGREWDCQCARCGSSAGWEDCWQCGGEGTLGSACIDDLCYGGECIHGDDDQIPCDICHGHGGWNVCVSGAEWCNAHPLPGREETKHGAIEWFTFDAPRPA